MFHVELTNVCKLWKPFIFWRDMLQTFCALIQAKLEYEIQYCFEFSALNLTVKMSNETRFSIMVFINSPLEGMWLVQWNHDSTNLYTKKIFVALVTVMHQSMTSQC